MRSYATLLKTCFGLLLLGVEVQFEVMVLASAGAGAAGASGASGASGAAGAAGSLEAPAPESVASEPE